MQQILKKHIVIGAVSHSGSTLLGLILGSLDGVANVGESHKLISGSVRSNRPSTDWSAYGEMYQCRLCGSACKVWTKSFRRSLQRDPHGWYAKLAARLAAETLVSSEKGLATIRRLDPELANTTIVLYRDPVQTWPSFVRRHWKNVTLPIFLRRWERVYGQFLDRDRYKPTGGVVYVGLDDFQRAPQEALKQLLERLELSDDPDALQYWRKGQHYISGSFNVYEKLKENGAEALEIRPPKAVSLSDEEVRAIRGHSAYEVFKKLQARSLLRVDGSPVRAADRPGSTMSN